MSIKSWTFAIALLNIFIDQLGAGVPVLHQFYACPIQITCKSPLIYAARIHTHFASFPSICLNLWCQRVSQSVPKGLIFSLFNKDKASSRPASVLNLDPPLGQSWSCIPSALASLIRELRAKISAISSPL